MVPELVTPLWPLASRSLSSATIGYWVSERFAGIHGQAVEQVNQAADDASTGMSEVSGDYADQVAGHAADVPDAFDRFLSPGRPAFMPRIGPTPREVIMRIHAAGGIASAAHPGKLKRDDIVEAMIAEGLDAVEVYHTDHTVADVVRYQELADTRGLLVTGGSDYHGPNSGRGGLGAVGLPTAAFARLAGHVAGRR